MILFVPSMIQSMHSKINFEALAMLGLNTIVPSTTPFALFFLVFVGCSTLNCKMIKGQLNLLTEPLLFKKAFKNPTQSSML